MVTVSVTRARDTVTMPSGQVGTPPSQVKFVVAGDALSLVIDGKDVKYVRIGAAPSATDALLEKWRMLPPTVPSTDPKMAAFEKAQANGVYSFNFDGTESVRIPFGSKEGTWDARVNTVQLPDGFGVYSFALSEGKLVLGEPPDGKKMDIYVPDELFE